MIIKSRSEERSRATLGSLLSDYHSGIGVVYYMTYYILVNCEPWVETDWLKGDYKGAQCNHAIATEISKEIKLPPGRKIGAEPTCTRCKLYSIFYTYI